MLRSTLARFQGPPPAGIRPLYCYKHQVGEPAIIETVPDGTRDHPNIPQAGLEPERYQIGLDVADLAHDDSLYERFVYQLGHELGHLLLEPRRANPMLETLAVARLKSVLPSSCFSPDTNVFLELLF